MLDLAFFGFIFVILLFANAWVGILRDTFFHLLGALVY